MTSTADSDWLTADTHMSRRRAVLLLLLAAAIVFLAGAQVQKRFGDQASGAATGLPSGFPTSMPTGAGGAVPGGQGAEPSDDETESDTSNVVGTLTSTKGNTWIVTDLGGKKHTITLKDDTRLREERTVESRTAKTGSTVDITGTKSSTGDVTATKVIIR